MVRGMFVAALFLVGSMSFVQAQETEVSFDGKWKLESMMMAGQNIGQTLGNVVLEVKGETYTVTINGQVQDKGKLEFDRAQNPIHVTIISETPDAPRFVGIGKVEEDKAVFAMRLTETGERPKTFEPNAQDATLMVSTYKREEE